MNNTANPLLRPLRRPTIVLGLALAFSVTGLAAPSPTSITIPTFDGYIGSDYGRYSLHNNGVSRSTGAWSLNGAYAFPIDSLSKVQFDADYFRLSHGSGVKGTNALSADLHYSYKMDDIPVGGFAGRFSNSGNATWGFGLEGSLPVGKWDWMPGGRSTWSDSAILNVQGFYARTGGSHTNGWGSRFDLRSYPCDDFRVNANFGLHHTSSSYGGPLRYTDNMYAFGLGFAYLFDCGYSVYGDYDHTYFSRSGLNVDGFTLGVRYFFGRAPKIRDTEGSGYGNFGRLLGVAAKF